MNRTLSPHELTQQLAASNTLQILDVRRRVDLDAAVERIPGAAWCDPESIAVWGAALPKDREVVVYCVRGGSVSNSVIDTLRARGIAARYIEGGITAWKAAGGATEPK